jgi:HNH endonuclease
MTASWKQLELRLAKMWGGQRAGPIGRDGPDIVGVPLAIQVKRTASTTGGIEGKWVRQARRDGKRLGLPWILVVAGHNDRAPVAVVDHAWVSDLAKRAGLVPLISAEDTARFWEKVDRSGDCWVWTAGTAHFGYGQFHLDGKPEKAHRISWILTYGPIPEGLLVCHHCDNPPCVNPRHLFVGSHRDNALDKVAKGRDPRKSQTHCQRGHEFTPANTYIRANGTRMCCECNREKRRERDRERLLVEAERIAKTETDALWGPE